MTAKFHLYAGMVALAVVLAALTVAAVRKLPEGRPASHSGATVR